MFSVSRHREKILGPALIVILFLLNLSIASRSPFGAWIDEVGYANAGLNLAAGKGWTIRADPWKTEPQFFAEGSPLYPGGLSLWVRVFGISMVSARSYCYFLAALGMLLLWLGTFRFDLLTPVYRLFWITLLSTEYAMNWMERNERYDVWIFVGLALAWFGASLHTPRAKYPAIFAGCFLIPWAGFVGVPYVFLVALLVLGLTQWKFWKEAIAGMAGAGIGVASVFMFFIAFGQLQAFHGRLSHFTVAQVSQAYSPLKVFLYPTDDWGVPVMIGLLIGLSLYYWKYPSSGSTSWLGLGWGLVVLMPCIMLMRGVFPMMYFYMLIIPLSLAILQLALQVQMSARGRYLAMAVTVMMGVLCLGGLPARLYTSWKYWDYRDPQHMQDFVRTYLRPDDVVFSDWPFYFQLRDYAKLVIMPDYALVISPDLAQHVNVALVRDSLMPDLSGDASGIPRIGGGWRKVAVFPMPEMLAKVHGVPGHETFTLYRRDVASP